MTRDATDAEKSNSKPAPSTTPEYGWLEVPDGISSTVHDHPQRFLSFMHYAICQNRFSSSTHVIVSKLRSLYDLLDDEVKRCRTMIEQISDVRWSAEHWVS